MINDTYENNELNQWNNKKNNEREKIKIISFLFS